MSATTSTTSTTRRGLGAGLPDFPWDTLAGARATANAYPGGVVDLSIGTPVDPTPEVAQRALTEAADSPGYPLTSGTPRSGRRSPTTWTVAGAPPCCPRRRCR